MEASMSKVQEAQHRSTQSTDEALHRMSTEVGRFLLSS
jgi:hypothetical protein